VDEKLPLGEHTLQVNGITAAGESSSISLPVVVVESQVAASKNAMVSTEGEASTDTGAWTISNYICWLLILLLLLIIAFIVRRIYLASRKKKKHK
jgi:flagellar biosynthesis/type III secretory pathway M-ring protein FliF/YscJ